MIKKDLTEAPVLAIPNTKGHMVLVLDTSKTACGSALCQEQKGRYRLIAYFSKKLPLSAQRYSISDLELTLSLKKLIENLNDYKFDMYVSDFLSRHPDDEESGNDPIIPVAFLMKEVMPLEHSPKFMEWLNIILNTREMLAYQKNSFRECKCERVMCMREPFKIMTRSMAKLAKADVPAMYPLKGGHKKPEKSQIGIIEVKDNQKQEQTQNQVDIPDLDIPTQSDNQIMADIDNMNIPDKTERPRVQNMPRLDMGNLQVPLVLNEPIPMKPVKKPTQVADFDEILAPVKIDVTLKGQLPPFDEKNFQAIYATAENLPDLGSLLERINLYLSLV